MAVRPFDSLHLGPVGLGHDQSVMLPYSVAAVLTHPTITGRFSFSASSKGVCGATRVSGVQSSTKSSISYHNLSQVQMT